LAGKGIRYYDRSPTHGGLVINALLTISLSERFSIGNTRAGQVQDQPAQGFDGTIGRQGHTRSQLRIPVRSNPSPHSTQLTCLGAGGGLSADAEPLVPKTQDLLNLGAPSLRSQSDSTGEREGLICKHRRPVLSCP